MESFVARTSNGAAVHCSCCGRLEVSLGNALLCLNAEDVDSVLEIIDSFHIDDPIDPHQGRRGFIIRTQHDDAAFAFTRGEIIEIRELILAASQPHPAIPTLFPPAERVRRPLFH